MAAKKKDTDKQASSRSDTDPHPEPHKPKPEDPPGNSGGGGDGGGGHSDLQAEIDRSHTALATLRKLAAEQPNLNAADVVRVLASCNVDTTDFPQLAAGA